MRFRCALSFLAVSSLLAGCIHAHHGHRQVPVDVPAAARRGPPPHAPAHGYRHKHAHGPELRYDRGLGVYVVLGHRDHYYHAGHFYRRHAGGWQVSVRIDGGWGSVAVSNVPGALHGRYKHKHGKHKRRGHPAKHRH